MPLAGLVLVTDGADNAEADIARPAPPPAARAVPVFTVGLGRERFAQGRRADARGRPASVLKGTSVTAEIARGPARPGRPEGPAPGRGRGPRVQSQEVTLPADGESAATRVHLTASEAGPRTFRFRIAAQPGEQIAENNQQDVLIEVADRREKILYFEGEPRFELKFIRRAVAEDKNLQVVVPAAHVAEQVPAPDVDDADELAGGLPKTREELFQYRGLILGSVEAGFFTADQLRMIADFVSQRGGGLLMLGGRHSFAEGGYARTPLADVLPVVLEAQPRRRAAFFAEIKVEPTRLRDDPRRHPARGHRRAERRSAGRRCRRSPRSTRSAARSPGAVDPARRARRRPARRRRSSSPTSATARGKSLAFTVHDSWLWQMHADIPLEDMTHENLWRQLLRWLVSGVPGPVTVSRLAAAHRARRAGDDRGHGRRDDDLPQGQRRPGRGAR